MISPIEEIIADFRAGKFVVLTDDESRENEGDLVIAADFVTAESVNFMARFGRGLICAAIAEEQRRRLQLPMMSEENSAPFETNFTVSVEAAEGVTTGISAGDRAKTIRAISDPSSNSSDWVAPGHIFPIAAKPGGVLVRAGHTEAGCDLAKLAGLNPAAAICEILRDDGEMARLNDLEKFAETHGLKLGTIESLIQHRLGAESLVEEISRAPLLTPWGEFTLAVFRDTMHSRLHLALVRGKIRRDSPALVRVSPEPTLLDAIAVSGIGHSWSVGAAAAKIAAAESGALILLNADDGSALSGQIRRLQSGGSADDGDKKSPHPIRTHGIGAQILRALGAGKIRLLSSPLRLPSMAGFGLEVVEIIEEDE